MFARTLPLRFGDCDPSGIAYYPSYLRILDGAIEDFFASLGAPRNRMIDEMRMGTPTLTLNLMFQRPGLQGDELDIAIRVVGLGRTSLDLAHTVSARGETLFTYGYPDPRAPTGITQGGYANNIVVRDHFAVHIPETIPLEEAAPLLCAGITTYSPIMQANLEIGDKVGVAGIGGLGHLAVKLAASKGAEVYAFTTSPDKVKDILAFGAKEVIVVDDLQKLRAHKGRLDYLINTIPVQYDVAAYASVVKPHGFYTQVGMAEAFSLNVSTIGLSLSRVNFNVALIGGIPETQEVMHYCADASVRPTTQLIQASEISDAWVKVKNKQARYRYVIDAATF